MTSQIYSIYLASIWRTCKFSILKTSIISDPHFVARIVIAIGNVREISGNFENVQQSTRRHFLTYIVKEWLEFSTHTHTHTSLISYINNYI